MKKIFSFAMAAVLLMAGCVKEDLSLNGNDGKVQVTFTANLPIEASRALVGDGSKVNELNYAIYDDAGKLFASYPYENDVEVIDNHATVTLDLVKGQSYKIAFWAQHSDAPYTFDRQNGKVTIDYSGTVLSNDEKFDAFYVLEPITVTGPDVKTVTLRRPFAQINLGATKADVDAAKALGIVIDKTKVTLSGVNQTLELFSGKAKDKTTAVVEFDYNALPGNDLTVNSVDYAYLAANYILANGDADVTELEFVVRQGSDDINTVKVPAVNYKRNYRTNILGRLLTSSVDFNIVIDGNPYGDLELSDDVKLAMAVLESGEYTLTNDVVLNAPLEVLEGVNFTLNLNGKTLSLATAKGEGAVISNKGTLTIKGDGVVESTTENGDAVINNEGTLVLADVTVNGAPIADGGYPEYAVINSGKMTIEEGTEISSDRGCLNLLGEGETVINGGSFTNNDIGQRALTSHVVYNEKTSSQKLTINGGTFQHLHAATSGGVVICNRSTATTYINNGSFSGGNYYGDDNLSDYGQNNTSTPFEVKGGTFSAKPAAKYIATGYKAMQKDGKWTVVEESVDAIVATDAELDAALQGGSDTIVLSAGTYVIPDSAKGKTLTIQGTGNPEDVVIAAQNDGGSEGQCDYSFDGSNVTFDGVTITSPGTYFPGYARMKGTYNNCIINGVWTTYDNSSFNGCTFNVSGNNYNLWTWGAAEVNLTDCTFNCEGKAVLLYGTANTKLTVNDSTFNDNGDDTVTGKAAIEIGNDYNKSYTLVVNNSVVNGFAVNPDGYVTGTTLWANKNSMPADKLKVTVDGQNAYIIVVADVAGLKSAVAAGSSVIGLKSGVYDTKDFQFMGKTLTLKGVEAGAKIFNSQNNAVASGSFDGCTITFEDLTIETLGGLYKGFARMNGNYKNCTIENNYFLFHNKHLFEGCTFNAPSGNEHCVWTYGATDVDFVDCEFNYTDRCVNVYVDNGANAPGITSDVAFTNCAFVTANASSVGAVEVNSSPFTAGVKVAMNGCTAPAHGHMIFVSKWDPTVGATATITVNGAAFSAPVQQ